MAVIKTAFPKPIADRVFAKTNGTCTYCDKPLVRGNYGQCGATPPIGAWEADHWLPKAAGGTDDESNLWPACCDCNDNKGADDGEIYILRRIFFESAKVNGEIVKRLVDEGPGRAKTGPR